VLGLGLVGPASAQIGLPAGIAQLYAPRGGAVTTFALCRHPFIFNARNSFLFNAKNQLKAGC
jgi:hypothetical protein